MIEMSYLCEITYDNGEVAQWNGTITMITKKAPYEVVLQGDGNKYHLIYSKYQSGYYLVIPEWFIGCEMSTYNDIVWNRGAIKRAGLNERETETIVQGISHIKQMLNF